MIFNILFKCLFYVYSMVGLIRHVFYRGKIDLCELHFKGGNLKRGRNVNLKELSLISSERHFMDFPVGEGILTVKRDYFREALICTEMREKAFGTKIDYVFPDDLRMIDSYEGFVKVYSGVLRFYKKKN